MKIYFLGHIKMENKVGKIAWLPKHIGKSLYLVKRKKVGIQEIHKSTKQKIHWEWTPPPPKKRRINGMVIGYILRTNTTTNNGTTMLFVHRNVPKSANIKNTPCSVRNSWKSFIKFCYRLVLDCEFLMLFPGATVVVARVGFLIDLVSFIWIVCFFFTS